MDHFSFHFNDPKTRRRAVLSTLAYWLAIAFLVAAMAFGIHRYFEYRNRELDKKLERLGSCESIGNQLFLIQKIESDL